MGVGVTGGASSSSLKFGTERINALVVEDVKILTKEVEVQVPKYVERIVEVPRYIDKDITVTHVTVQEEIVNTKNVVVEEVTVETQRALFKDIIVERPVYKDVEIERYIIKKIDMPIEVPKLIEKVRIVEREQEIKTYKLVEEIIKVPKISYVPTEIERVVWKDVERERCSHCGKPV